MLKHETAKAEPAEEVEGKLILIDLAGFEDNRLAVLAAGFFVELWSKPNGKMGTL